MIENVKVTQDGEIRVARGHYLMSIINVPERRAYDIAIFSSPNLESPGNAVFYPDEVYEDYEHYDLNTGVTSVLVLYYQLHNFMNLVRDLPPGLSELS